MRGDIYARNTAIQRFRANARFMPLKFSDNISINVIVGLSVNVSSVCKIFIYGLFELSWKWSCACKRIHSSFVERENNGLKIVWKNCIWTSKLIMYIYWISLMSLCLLYKKQKLYWKLQGLRNLDYWNTRGAFQCVI